MHTMAAKSGARFLRLTQGLNQALFYKRLIKVADEWFDSHLRQVKAAQILKR